jgi:hypothetical protein
MTVWIVVFEGVDESTIEGVYANREAAEAHVAADTTWQGWLEIHEYEAHASFEGKAQPA